jgi:hypothetical protein
VGLRAGRPDPRACAPQDLTLRHGVKDYRAGDLERRYAKLGVEEDFFVTYGFVTSFLQALCIHARIPSQHEPSSQSLRQRKLREFHEDVKARGDLRKPIRQLRALAHEHRRVHRAVLQPTAIALGAGLRDATKHE